MLSSIKDKPDRSLREDHSNTENIASVTDFCKLLGYKEYEAAIQVVETCSNLDELLTQQEPILGLSPLYYAAMESQIKLVRAIVKKASSLQKVLEMQLDGISTLDVILMMCVDESVIVDIVKMIISKVDDLDKLLAKQSKLLRSTPLHDVIYSRQPELLRLLLANANDKEKLLTIKTKQNETPVHAAFSKSGNEKTAEVMRQALQDANLMHLIDRD